MDCRLAVTLESYPRFGSLSINAVADRSQIAAARGID
jgi:hypothetical protein